MLDAGRDGFWLLSQIEQKGQAAWQDLPEIVTLRQVLEQQFDQDDGEGSSLGATEKGVNIDGWLAMCISSPHGPGCPLDSKKNKNTEWRGYKAQVTETVDGDLAVITDIGIHSAIEQDGLALRAIQERLAQRVLLPDIAVRGWGLLQWQDDGKQRARAGIDLRGFIGSYSRKLRWLSSQDFDIDLENGNERCVRQAIDRHRL